MRISDFDSSPCRVILNGGKAVVKDRTTTGSFDVVDGKAHHASGTRDLDYFIAA